VSALYAAPRLRSAIASAQTNPSRTRALIRGPKSRLRHTGYLPDHIPQWLPDDWLTHLTDDDKPTSRRQQDLLRRAAAIRLVQMASNTDSGEASRFLGISDVWWLPDAIPHWNQRLPRNVFQHDDDLARLADTLDGRTDLIDFRRRRLSLVGWILPEREGRTIHAQHPAPGGRGGPELDEHRRRTVSDFIRTRVTGSERRLAPHTAETGRVSWSWRRISHAKPPTPGSPYVPLRRLLQE
jgi:hypothetical protein